MAKEWLAAREAQPPPPVIAHAALYGFCRVLAMRMSTPGAISVLEDSSRSTDEDAHVARDAIAHVAAVENTLKLVHDKVIDCAMAKTPAGRACLLGISHALTLDTAPCQGGQCCLTRLSDVPLCTLVLIQAGSQGGQRRETHVVAKCLYSFAVAWFGISGLVRELMQYTQDWIKHNGGGVGRLSEIPIVAQMHLLNALNKQIEVVWKAIHHPSFIA